jgi:hypothetical protein
VVPLAEENAMRVMGAASGFPVLGGERIAGQMGQVVAAFFPPPPNVLAYVVTETLA